MRLKAWQKGLPSLYEQKNSEDPMIYARFESASSRRVWYVAEGSRSDDDFEYFGFIEGENGGDAYFFQSDLDRLKAVRDQNFVPQPLSSIMPLAV